ncbi:MAG: ATP-binding protein [Thermoclostridium sp.]|nr:ATP-binding protein [Thermoclostridium sp.]
MNTLKVPRRVSTALLNSLSAGVTPRIGLEYMAVGRKREIETLLEDLANIREGGSVFRVIVGRYGSGKSFLLQIIRNYAMDRDYVVIDADLSPERKLTGNRGSGLATYRELLQNMATKVRPDGGALNAILERWIAAVQMQLMKDEGFALNDPLLAERMELSIMQAIHSMDDRVHGYDFARVLSAFWQGHRTGSDEMKSAALKWLRGEYQTKTEANTELDVRVIIDDDTWFDYIKLFSDFVKQLGYAGLIMLLDEGVNLYKISNTQSRNNNYEKLLNMFNDTMQGKVQGLGVYLCGTPQFVEDNRRGLFSYEALRTRLAGSRFAKELRDMQGPLIYLDKLTYEELFVLLHKILEIHIIHYGWESGVSEEDLLFFLQQAVNRIGADEWLTPREIVRDFISVLNLVRQNPEQTFKRLVTGDLFKTTPPAESNDMEETDAAEFSL